MNAAARLVHQHSLPRYLMSTQQFTKHQLTILLLGAAVLFSALSTIYVTHTARILHAAYQHNIAEQDRLHIQRSQLLLERSTWMVQARIQHIAESQLGMIIPERKSVVVIHEGEPKA